MNEKQRRRADRKAMRTAAQLLVEHAGCISDACKGGSEKWACGDCDRDASGKCEAQLDYEAHLYAAEGLLKIARRAA